jgi:hypothetical protein
LTSKTRVDSEETNSRSCETKISVPGNFSRPEFSDFDRFHVEVVGRFVHQQHVRPRQHQLAEQHAALLAAGDHVDRLLDVVAGEQQTAEVPRIRVSRSSPSPAVTRANVGDPVGQVSRRSGIRPSGPARSSRAGLFRPLDRAVPAAASPISSFSSVVLPTPFSPMMATFSPALMVSVRTC